MADEQHFGIQREDGAWYAGVRDDGTPLWDDDVREAKLFDVYMEALGTLTSLQDAGYPVRLFGVDPNTRGT